jgi:hypothetical protein
LVGSDASLTASRVSVGSHLEGGVPWWGPMVGCHLTASRVSSPESSHEVAETAVGVARRWGGAVGGGSRTECTSSPVAAWYVELTTRGTREEAARREAVMGGAM